MLIRQLYCLFAITLTTALCLSSAAHATTMPNQQPYTDGKEYVVLPPAIQEKFVPSPGKIKIFEFFSYGCPACYATEPLIQAWLQTKPDHIEFTRVPVVFRADWTILAKAYYTAHALGVDSKITPALFDAIHRHSRDLSTREAMEKFFIEQGVKKEDFESAFDFSPGIDAELMRTGEMMKLYQIFRIPTIIINGKYKVDPKTAGGPKELFAVVNYLVKEGEAQTPNKTPK